MGRKRGERSSQAAPFYSIHGSRMRRGARSFLAVLLTLQQPSVFGVSQPYVRLRTSSTRVAEDLARDAGVLARRTMAPRG